MYWERNIRTQFQTPTVKLFESRLQEDLVEIFCLCPRMGKNHKKVFTKEETSLKRRAFFAEVPGSMREHSAWWKSLWVWTISVFTGYY